MTFGIGRKFSYYEAIVLILKNGMPGGCKSHLGIRLIPTATKILALIILRCLTPVLDGSIREQQAEFGPDHDCIDQTFYSSATT